MKLKRVCLSLATLVIILISTVAIMPIPAQEELPEEPPEESPWWKEEQMNGTFLYWDKDQEIVVPEIGLPVL